MDTIFCTLFDTGYLDKAFVLIDSMEKRINAFKLYAFCFDDISYNIITNEKFNNVIPISLHELESFFPCLKDAKKDRNAVEYNWTCSAWTIKFVIEHYGEKICTYIDADMKFFSSPEFVFAKMREAKQSVIIVPHRFRSDEFEKEEGPLTGFYCVEFNTFINNENGMKALNWWADNCLKWCHYVIPSIQQWYGDQKYLNEFPLKFDGVHVCDDYGVGLGPWNDNRMLFESQDTTNVILKDKDSNIKYPLVLYHYAGVRFLSKSIVVVSSQMKSGKLHKIVFDQYVKDIVKKRNEIKTKYGISLATGIKALSKNPLVFIYQKYITPIKKLKKIHNVYFIK